MRASAVWKIFWALWLSPPPLNPKQPKGGRTGQEEDEEEGREEREAKSALIADEPPPISVSSHSELGVIEDVTVIG